MVDPNPKDPNQFFGSGSKIFSTDPNPDLNLAHRNHPFSHVLKPSSHVSHPSSFQNEVLMIFTHNKFFKIVVKLVKIITIFFMFYKKKEDRIRINIKSF